MHRALVLLVAGLILVAGCSDSDDENDGVVTPEPSANGLTPSVDPGEAASGGAIRLTTDGPGEAQVSYGADVLLKRSENGGWIGSHRLIALEAGGGASPVGESTAVPAIAYTAARPWTTNSRSCRPGSTCSVGRSASPVVRVRSPRR